jgi:formylglycine-generating enzyme required for sulfatase activity
MLAHTDLLALHAPSGYGKSSFVAGGLVWDLRRAKTPVAMDDTPSDAGLAHRLLATLLEHPPQSADPSTFAATLHALARQGAPPVLVLDQFEDLFKTTDDPRRASVAHLIAATRLLRLNGQPICRWVLAFREEFLGPVQAWLKRPLRDATWLRTDPTLGFQPAHQTPWIYPLPALGTSDPQAAFTHAIRAPLQANPESGWTLSEPGLTRLATAFAAERGTDPSAPLVPELQVTLRQLGPAQPGPIEVPPDLDAIQAMVRVALTRHLRENLGRVFRDAPDPLAAQSAALAALARMVDPQGRALTHGLPADALPAFLTDDILERLAIRKVRLVYAVNQHLTPRRWRLSHDQLAQAIHQLTRSPAPSGFDPALIALAGRVTQRTQRHAAQEPDATRLGWRDLRAIHRRRPLLLGPTEAPWWRAAKRTALRTALTISLIIGTVVGGAWAIARARTQAQIAQAVRLLEQAPAEATEVLTLLAEALDAGADEARLRALILAKRPWAAALAAPTRPVEPARGKLIAWLAEVATTADEFGHLVAGSEVARHPETPGNLNPADYTALRQALNQRLRAQFPGPSAESLTRLLQEQGLVDAQRPFWVPVPGGIFIMGSGQMAVEAPKHPVQVRAIELMRFEVTRGLWAAFSPHSLRNMDATQPITAALMMRWHADLDIRTAHLPVWSVTWFEAQAFAAWLDPLARLPTEAEWEYATRGGQTTSYWSGEGDTDLATVGWYKANSGNRLHEVCEKQDAPDARAHPLGLCDVHGNVSEWTSDGYTDDGYQRTAATDPSNLRRAALRVLRGGSFLHEATGCRSAVRYGVPPGTRGPSFGFRLVRPRLAPGHRP